MKIIIELERETLPVVIASLQTSIRYHRRVLADVVDDSSLEAQSRRRGVALLEVALGTLEAYLGPTDPA
jgi:hypothetical protein